MKNSYKTVQSRFWKGLSITLGWMGVIIFKWFLSRGVLRFQSKRLITCISLIVFISVNLVLISNKAVRAQLPQTKDQALELQHIGESIARSILTKDIEGILRYDRPDLVEDDRKLLRDKKSDLYCYLFQTSCITWKGQAIYDVLHSALKLAIKVKDLGNSEDGSHYSMVLFFDGSNIKEPLALSPDFLCKEGGKEIVTWTFKDINGKWVSAHPPFDAETDVYCNSK